MANLIPTTMTFEQISKDVKTYLIIVIVGLLFNSIRQSYQKSDKDDVRCEKALAAKDVIIAKQSDELRAVNKENTDFYKMIVVQKGMLSLQTTIVEKQNDSLQKQRKDDKLK
ncbi:hypothetical protein [Pedobacter sp. MR2016-24]|uniref:hypothetical protein n=1 Tax=Pedobacter sp. MR2016-24 TaxID=2994466 RepID=UPI0022456F7F|nr:hypothetical protein [Pedobacter sp. MR2016-24]MCX2486615.1 hypothetical protein [Pedobacter sp. MR2016-24]